ncbi:hypothetical protein SH2C18_23110 [Clostridium sediminicola]|uniref:anti sigma factor C-terminal domain-containing protein n=1 Tax=Clostridium sediminicola TaxID=3114879 RepID=UPI0031F1C899
MNSDFQEKLHLYKEGKLNQNEIPEIECEIDKFSAIWDYLNDDDKAFFEELKLDMPERKDNQSKSAKLFKRRVNLRIAMMTTITVLSASIIIILLIFLTSNITMSLFGLNYKESYVKRAAIVQLAQIFHPQYEYTSSSEATSLFAQQSIDVHLNNTVGHTIVDETELKVKYSLGRLVQSKQLIEAPFFPTEHYSLLNSHESDPISGFKILENAPQGTVSKIFVEFNKTLTAQQLKDYSINQINNMDITPIVAVDSKLVLANPSYYGFTRTYPYDKNKDNDKQMEDNSLKQTQYENMDDQAHKDSLIGNLNLIKNNLQLLQVMYYDDIFNDINFDNLIKDVENNGAQYVGMYITADSKELLNLKDNPLIHCIWVENIVVW